MWKGCVSYSSLRRGQGANATAQRTAMILLPNGRSGSYKEGIAGTKEHHTCIGAVWSGRSHVCVWGGVAYDVAPARRVLVEVSYVFGIGRRG